MGTEPVFVAPTPEPELDADEIVDDGNDVPVRRAAALIEEALNASLAQQVEVEPEPVVIESVPEPEPEPVVVESAPEPEPVAVESVPEPEPVAVESAPEPVQVLFTAPSSQ